MKKLKLTQKSIKDCQNPISAKDYYQVESASETIEQGSTGSGLKAAFFAFFERGVMVEGTELKGECGP